MRHSLLRLSVLALLLTIKMAVYAQTFEVNGIKYSVTSSSTVKVGSENNCSGDLIIPETVEYNGTTYSVTSIDWAAFLGCSSLTSVTIPNSVTVIGRNAFQGCI